VGIVNLIRPRLDVGDGIRGRRTDGFQRQGHIFGGGRAVLVQARSCRVSRSCTGHALEALADRPLVFDSRIREWAPRSHVSVSSLRSKRPTASSHQRGGAGYAIGLTPHRSRLGEETRSGSLPFPRRRSPAPPRRCAVLDSCSSARMRSIFCRSSRNAPLWSSTQICSSCARLTSRPVKSACALSLDIC